MSFGRFFESLEVNTPVSTCVWNSFTSSSGLKHLDRFPFSCVLTLNHKPSPELCEYDAFTPPAPPIV